MKEQIRILTSLIAVFALTGVKAQTAAPVPRLVVAVVVDQLRSDYMDAFMPLYGEGGFKRLMKEGFVYQGAQYPVADVDRASATATLFTGTVPYNHGIVGKQWLDKATLRPLFCVDDAAFAGWNTEEKSSPKFLEVSTLGDELKVATDGKSIVYSVSPYRDAAILAAGHAADGAFWINDQDGLWSGTSYYGPLPSWVLMANRPPTLEQRLGEMVYEPYSQAVGQFNYFVSGGIRTPFKHKFPADRRFSSFKSSALVNQEVTQMAKNCIFQTMMGVDQVTDLLVVSYNAGNFENKSVLEYPIEMQDTYVRLDQCLQELFGVIDQKVGLENALIVLTSTGYVSPETADLSKYRIPQGNFYINRTAMLLNMYFMAVYGHGQYVDAVFGNQIYLNHKLLENKQINEVEVQERAQEFLLQCSGVKDVYTSQRLTLGAWTPGISRYRNAYNPKCSGDICIEVAPGWNLVNEDMHTTHPVRVSYVEFPLIFFGYNLVSRNLYVPVSVDAVAPTLAHFMRIRAPNACSVAPLNDVRQ